MLIKIKTSRFCRVCNRCVEEQHVQVFLKLTMNTKPDNFSDLRSLGNAAVTGCVHSAGCCAGTCPGSSGLTGGTPPHQASPISTVLSSRRSLDVSRSRYCHVLTSCTACQNQRKLPSNTSPPVLHKCECLWVYTGVRELRLHTGEGERRDQLHECYIQQKHLMIKHTWLFTKGSVT